MTIHQRVEGGVAVLTIDRPDCANALDAPTSDELSRAVRAADADRSVGAIVVTGAGTRSFCAGMDIKAAAREGSEAHMRVVGGFGGLTRAHYSTPLVAAVNGAAAGGGFELVLACDLVVAADHATFSLPEVKRGRLAGGGGALRVASLLPRALALEILLLGEPLGAGRAEAMGLVNRIVPIGELLDAACGLARTIAANAPLSVAGSKEIVDAVRGVSEAAWRRNDEVAARVRASHDAAEGLRAFVERRRPVWRGG